MVNCRPITSNPNGQTNVKPGYGFVLRIVVLYNKKFFTQKLKSPLIISIKNKVQISNKIETNGEFKHVLNDFSFS